MNLDSRFSRSYQYHTNITPISFDVVTVAVARSCFDWEPQERWVKDRSELWVLDLWGFALDTWRLAQPSAYWSLMRLGCRGQVKKVWMIWREMEGRFWKGFKVWEDHVIRDDHHWMMIAGAKFWGAVAGEEPAPYHNSGSAEWHGIGWTGPITFDKWKPQHRPTRARTTAEVASFVFFSAKNPQFCFTYPGSTHSTKAWSCWHLTCSFSGYFSCLFFLCEVLGKDAGYNDLDAPWPWHGFSLALHWDSAAVPSAQEPDVPANEPPMFHHRTSHNSSSRHYFPLPCWLTKPRLYRSRGGGNAETVRSAIAVDHDSLPWILNPTGHFRNLWDFIGIGLLTLDTMILPVQFVNEDFYSQYPSLAVNSRIAAFYWLTDIVLSFFTGYLKNPSWEQADGLFFDVCFFGGFR